MSDLKFGEFLYLELTNLNQCIIILSHIVIMVGHDHDLRSSTTHQYSLNNSHSIHLQPCLLISMGQGIPL